jgi:transposase
VKQVHASGEFHISWGFRRRERRPQTGDIVVAADDGPDSLWSSFQVFFHFFFPVMPQVCNSVNYW